MYKAICTDIDGTLLNAERKLSKRTIAAFKALNKDIPVILASSRMPAAMRHLQETLGIGQQPLICYNGGFIIDENRLAVPLDSVTIPFTIAEKIALWSENNALHASFYFEDSWYAPALDQWTEREINNTQVKASILSNSGIINRWRERQSGAHKIMCMGEPDLIDALVKELSDSREPLHLYRSKDTYLEIAPLQISKATALKMLLKNNYDFSINEVVAFGDNFNDIELLKEVGKGIAVANAKDELKAVANEITDTSKADGVAKAIEKHFLSYS